MTLKGEQGMKTSSEERPKQQCPGKRIAPQQFHNWKMVGIAGHGIIYECYVCGKRESEDERNVRTEVTKELPLGID